MKVCILAAGIGSRLGERTRFFNKAILRVGDQAAISHTISAFPPATEFVIAIGYQKDIVKQYLQIAHPEVNFTFVETDKYSGPGAGAGYALLQCKQHLNEPFYFVCCDSIIEWDQLPTWKMRNRDWVVCSFVDDSKRAQYCTVKPENGRAISFFDKTSNGTNLAFTGVAFIKSHETFWIVLESLKTNEGEIRDTPAIFSLNPFILQRDWNDIGCEEGLKEARKAFGGIQNLDKLDEEIYFVGSNVIKYFYNEKMVEDRIRRVEHLNGTVPQILKHSKNFYSYPKAPGKDLFKLEVSEEMMVKLLDYAQEKLWSHKTHLDGPFDKKIFEDSCKKFYCDKTISRVKSLYDKKIELTESDKYHWEAALKRINWGYISEGIPSKFHGDFNFSNVLYDEKTDRFTLLDWRQNFGDKIAYGDVYYDLAKMYHSFLFPHSSVQKGKFYTSRNKYGNVKSFIEIPCHIEKCKDAFEAWVEKNDYDLWKIKLLTGIVLLNMSPLHESPIDEFLYHYSTSYLWEVLREP